MTGTDVRAASCGYLLNQQTLIKQCSYAKFSLEGDLYVQNFIFDRWEYRG